MSTLVAAPRSFGWPETLAAVGLSIIAFAAAGLEPRALPLLYLAAVTPALWVTDLVSHRLPNRLVLPGYPVAAVGVVAQWVVSSEPPVVALVSGAAYFVVMLVFGLAGGMGMGDVKLAGVLGLAAGAIGPATAVLSPVLAFLVGGVAAVVVLARGRRGRIPFGPFLLAGFWIAAVLGS